MLRVCGWCKKDMGSTQDESRAITHGICKSCMFHVKASVGLKFSEFLNGLEVPIAVVAPEEGGVLKVANATLKNALGKSDAQIIDNLGGVVFECTYSYLPEGCGKTEHCGACTIRNAVTETYKTGESKLNAPASLNQKTGDRVKKLKLTISTEKVDNMVLLRIDKMEEES